MNIGLLKSLKKDLKKKRNGNCVSCDLNLDDCSCNGYNEAIDDVLKIIE